MKSMATLLALGLSASVALADNARPRSGNSGSSSGSGARHSGASSSGASNNNGSSGGSNVQRDRSSGSAGVTGAQARHPRAGTGTGDRFRGRGRGYYPYYYYGYGYPRSYAYFGYSPFWYDDYYFGYGGYGYLGGGYYGPRRAYYDDNRSSVRIQVQPEKATVYVDGYYAGVVDDFNGLFQRLNLSPGRHEVTVRMDGYRTHTWKIYAPSGQTIKLQYDLVKGDGADPVDEMPGARPVAYQRESGDPEYDRDAPSSRPMARNERPAGDPGRVRLNFRPDDATIYIDGEFRGKAGQVQTVELSPGSHRIEVVRPGFVTYEREIEVQSGDNADLRVELEPRR